MSGSMLSFSTTLRPIVRNTSKRFSRISTGRPLKDGCERNLLRLRRQRSLMKFKLLNESGEKTFALIFEKGDEVIGSLKQFATEQRLLASHFTAIGALSDAV